MELFKSEYYSMSDTLLLPLTGLTKTEKFEVKSYLFWRDYSIFDYKLIVSIYFENDYNDIRNYCNNYFFPILSKNGYLVESYDIGKRTIFILDMSEWAKDIEYFLEGKYSKMSLVAKGKIKDYHVLENGRVPQSVFIIIYPNDKLPSLDNLSAIEYANKEYGINLKKLGEVGNKYDKMAETLFTEVEEIRHFDSE